MFLWVFCYLFSHVFDELLKKMMKMRTREDEEMLKKMDVGIDFHNLAVTFSKKKDQRVEIKKLIRSAMDHLQY